ncbi:MAG: hypothetical protein JW806_07855 [Sedimentisphaerales bacterium]|nr:hypothetical protein [Sedimentisphaerales bacterium]
MKQLRIIIALVIVICLIIYGLYYFGIHKYDGMYISNKDQTISYLKENNVLSGERLDKVSEILGTTKVELDGKRCTLISDDYVETDEVRILSRDRNTLVVEIFSDVWNKTIKGKLVFDDGGYWVYQDFPIPGYGERFDKID